MRKQQCMMSIYKIHTLVRSLRNSTQTQLCYTAESIMVAKLLSILTVLKNYGHYQAYPSSLYPSVRPSGHGLVLCCVALPIPASSSRKSLSFQVSTVFRIVLTSPPLLRAPFHLLLSGPFPLQLRPAHSHSLFLHIACRPPYQ